VQTIIIISAGILVFDNEIILVFIILNYGFPLCLSILA
jgi:hypothetical protein